MAHKNKKIIVRLPVCPSAKINASSLHPDNLKWIGKERCPLSLPLGHLGEIIGKLGEGQQVNVL